MARPKLLFLAHRIPYPPTKGEKLRAFHLIRGLQASYDVHLGAPADDPADWPHREALARECTDCFIADARGRSRRTAAVEALARGEAVTFSYFRNRALLRWVRETTAQHAFDTCLLYSSGTLPYLDAMSRPAAVTIADFVDVDSEKWRALAAKTPGPMGRIYAREARLLRTAETALASRADASLLVTESEARLFRKVTGISERIHAIGNGVDLALWGSAATLPSPYEPGPPVAIFTGAMDYEPNIEAVCWFASTVLPLLRNRGRAMRFVIAGSNPDKRVRALEAQPEVMVTGRVDDMRPWLAHADLALAPLKLARGVQNKVLEAMAAGTPSIVTRAALEGISARHGQSVTVAESGPDFAGAICDLLDQPELARTIAQEAQAVIAESYGWPARIAELTALIDAAGCGTAGQSAA